MKNTELIGTAIRMRRKDLKITQKELAERIPAARSFIVVEMNAGQMLHDVREVVGGRVPVAFYGRMGGIIPLPEEIETEIRRQYAQVARTAMPMEARNGHHIR